MTIDKSGDFLLNIHVLPADLGEGEGHVIDLLIRDTVIYIGK